MSLLWEEAMKKLITVFLLWAGVVFAQEEIAPDQYIEAQPQQKPTNCWPLMYTLEGIKEQGLVVIWQAKNQDDQWKNNQVLFVGANNQWVLLEMNDVTACVLGSGAGYYLIDRAYGAGESNL